MAAVVEGAGVELAYEEHGTGPAVLLVHGIAADRAAWGPLAPALALHSRAIAYDRRGYGGSGAPEAYRRTTVHEQAEDAVALLGALRAAPAVVVGADLGALVCLDLLLRHRALVTAAVLVDPPLLALVPEATEALSAERGALEEALRAGGPAAGVDAWLDEAVGAVEEARRARARAAALAFFADYGALATLPVSRRELRAIDAPVAILDGERAVPHVRAAAAALAALVPGARRDPAGDVVGAVRDVLGSAP